MGCALYVIIILFFMVFFNSWMDDYLYFILVFNNYGNLVVEQLSYR